MSVFHADLASRPAPRYTSYPTAAEFDEAVGAADHAAALRGLGPDDRISLYLHIPYCHEICWYCGCNTGALGPASRLDRYVDALIAEIETVARQTRARVSRVHFGGGSPNALAPAQFDRIATGLRAHFRIEADAEWAVELDPRHLETDLCQSLANNGVRRVSIGVQTFDLHVQRTINRIQPFRMVASAVERLRRAGVEHLNLDLMYGLPNQTLDSIAQTIARARQLGPDRVAMFGYAHLPQSLPRQRMIDESRLPGPEARFWQSRLAEDLWIEAGYRAVGFDHFALPSDRLALANAMGRLRRNFQGFTDDDGSAVIGLGASSISSFPGLLIQSEKHVGRYRMKVTNGQLAAARGVVRTDEDRRTGQVIERLLCDGRVDLVDLGWSPHMARRAMLDVAPALASLAERGLVQCHATGLSIEPDGAPYARLAAIAFDRFRSVTAERFSAAV